MKRKDFINNIRWITVLWLIPFHAACIFKPQARGDFYIVGLKGGDMIYECIRIASMPWMMPVLFAVAGASACYALRNRTLTEYAKERVYRLLIPLIFAMVLFSPLQGYVGALHHGDFSRLKPYSEYLKIFLTTTGNGYRGAFSFNSFWFIRHLFFMNVLLFPLMAWFQKKGKKLEAVIGKLPVIALVGLFIFPFEGYYTNQDLLSFREYLAFFALGFLVLSNEEVQERLSKWCWPLMTITVLLSAWNLRMCLRGAPPGVGYLFFYRFLRWISVLTIFGIFKCCFDRRCKVTDYLTKSSYAYYLLHEHTLLVVVQFIIRRKGIYSGNGIHKLYILAVLIACAATFLQYEVIHRIPGLRLMLGERPKKKEDKQKAIDSVTNQNLSANLLRSKFYVCPVCGNVIHSDGELGVNCCGAALTALEAKEPDSDHMLRIEEVEDEHFITIDHPMTKDHHITFIAFVTTDRMQTVKLYPEGNAQTRMQLRGRGFLYFFCKKHGLFRQKI